MNYFRAELVFHNRFIEYSYYKKTPLKEKTIDFQ
jgi:hypothetical protein